MLKNKLKKINVGISDARRTSSRSNQRIKKRKGSSEVVTSKDPVKGSALLTLPRQLSLESQISEILEEEIDFDVTKNGEMIRQAKMLSDANDLDPYDPVAIVLNEVPTEYVDLHLPDAKNLLDLSIDYFIDLLQVSPTSNSNSETKPISKKAKRLATERAARVEKQISELNSKYLEEIENKIVSRPQLEIDSIELPVPQIPEILEEDPSKINLTKDLEDVRNKLTSICEEKNLPDSLLRISSQVDIAFSEIISRTGIQDETNRNTLLDEKSTSKRQDLTSLDSEIMDINQNENNVHILPNVQPIERNHGSGSKNERIHTYSMSDDSNAVISFQEHHSNAYKTKGSTDLGMHSLGKDNVKQKSQKSKAKKANKGLIHKSEINHVPEYPKEKAIFDLEQLNQEYIAKSEIFGKLNTLFHHERRKLRNRRIMNKVTSEKFKVLKGQHEQKKIELEASMKMNQMTSKNELAELEQCKSSLEVLEAREKEMRHLISQYNSMREYFHTAAKIYAKTFIPQSGIDVKQSNENNEIFEENISSNNSDELSDVSPKLSIPKTFIEEDYNSEHSEQYDEINAENNLIENVQTIEALEEFLSHSLNQASSELSKNRLDLEEKEVQHLNRVQTQSAKINALEDEIAALQKSLISENQELNFYNQESGSIVSFIGELNGLATGVFQKLEAVSIQRIFREARHHNQKREEDFTKKIVELSTRKGKKKRNPAYVKRKLIEKQILDVLETTENQIKTDNLAVPSTSSESQEEISNDLVHRVSTKFAAEEISQVINFQELNKLVKNVAPRRYFLVETGTTALVSYFLDLSDLFMATKQIGKIPLIWWNPYLMPVANVIQDYLIKGNPSSHTKRNARRSKKNTASEKLSVNDNEKYPNKT